MLLGNFFTINSIERNNNSVNAVLQISPSHPIFKGHFPGLPVVPGVCMVQMVKEVLEYSIDHPTMLTAADHLKFLTIISPEKNNIVHTAIQFDPGDADINVSASLFNNSNVFLKIQAIFRKI